MRQSGQSTAAPRQLGSAPRFTPGSMSSVRSMRPRPSSARGSVKSSPARASPPRLNGERRNSRNKPIFAGCGERYGSAPSAARGQGSGAWLSRGVSVGLGLLEETVRVVPEKLLLRVRSEPRPSEDVVDRLRELALRVRVVGGVHQDTVAENPGHGIEHVLALLALDAAEEAAIRQVFARGVLQGCRAADIAGLLVHPPRPERQPAEAAFEHPQAQA